jgi:hypothetical protein
MRDGVLEGSKQGKLDAFLVGSTSAFVCLTHSITLVGSMPYGPLGLVSPSSIITNPCGLHRIKIITKDFDFLGFNPIHMDGVQNELALIIGH